MTTMTGGGEARIRGNEAFARGDFDEAVRIYEEGINFLPKNVVGEEEKETDSVSATTAPANVPMDEDQERAVLLSNLAAARIKQERWEEAANAATRAIEAGPPNEKALERRAYSYARIDAKLDEALRIPSTTITNWLRDYRELMQLFPDRTNYAEKVSEVEAKIKTRNEALKDEMIGKLKTFGNFCLKPFGLSTDSFEMTPNGEGGYSLNVKQGGQP